MYRKPSAPVHLCVVTKQKEDKWKVAYGPEHLLHSCSLFAFTFELLLHVPNNFSASELLRRFTYSRTRDFGILWRVKCNAILHGAASFHNLENLFPYWTEIIRHFTLNYESTLSEGPIMTTGLMEGTTSYGGTVSTLFPSKPFFLALPSTKVEAPPVVSTFSVGSAGVTTWEQGIYE